MKNIVLMLLTWSPAHDDERTLYAHRTLRAFLDHARLDEGDNLFVHVADDGSWEGHVDALAETAKLYGYTITSTNAERGGYGRSFNLATQQIHAYAVDAVIPLEDDWELTQDLNISALANALDEEGIECIRLGYLGFTQQLFGVVTRANDMTVLLFDPESSEPHVFAGHPRIETVAFQRAIGPWNEGQPAGATEFEVAHRPAARRGVAWPLDIKGQVASQDYGSLFAHIGTRSVNGVDPNAGK